MIQASSVEKVFGKFRALRGLNLTVSPGECVGLLGPNGAGKSTFISTLYGATVRSGGELKVFGMDPNLQAREIKKRLGVVPQENALDESLSVVANMKLYGRFSLLEPSLVTERLSGLLKYMSLDHKASSPIRTLSGGMKRRLVFVRALLTNPELLILDEPTTGLDPAVRHLLWQKVEELQRSGKTILITTHYMHEAEALCDRVVIMNQGKVVDEGSPKKLIEKHAPGFVGIFEGDDSLGARLRDALAAAGDVKWVLYKQRDAWCVRAPELNLLLEFQKRHSLSAVQMRPANLEDVYLLLTGEELSAND